MKLICWNDLDENIDLLQSELFKSNERCHILYSTDHTLIFEAAEFKFKLNGPRDIKYRTIYLSVNQFERLQMVLKRKSFKFNKTELPCLCYTKHVLFNTTDPLRLTTCLSLSLPITLSLSLHLSPSLPVLFTGFLAKLFNNTHAKSDSRKHTVSFSSFRLFLLVFIFVRNVFTIIVSMHLCP